MTPNGIIRSYRVQYNEIDTNDDNFDTTDNMTTLLIIGMLEKFTTYEVQVFATTVEQGNGSEIVTVTTDEDSELHVYSDDYNTRGPESTRRIYRFYSSLCQLLNLCS